MAVRHGYGKIAGADALQFAYDTGDTRNSYKGEPTTNLITHVLPNSNWNTNGSGVIITQNYGYDHNGVLRSSKIMDNPNSGNASFAYTSAFNVSAGTYTFSAMVKTSSANASNNSSMVLYNMNPITNLGETSFASITPGVWTKVSVTGTLASGTTHIAPHFFSLSGDGTNFIEVVDVQLEQKSHATPFAGALGTRSATQGLLDITGNYSIDLSNVSFDSNAMLDFDGTNDYITLANTDLRPGFTLETVCYPEAATFAVWGQGPTVANRGLHIVATNSYRGFVYGMYGNDRDYGNYIPTLNQWYHWVFTYDGTSFAKEFFADGEKQTPTASVQGEWIEAASALRLGTNYGSGTSYSKANGKIAVAKYYNRPLTDDEIRNNFRHYKTRFNI